MNWYSEAAKGLLFLNGHVTDPRMDDGYGPSYGNRRANARRLRQPWQAPAEAVAEALARPAPDAGTCVACAQPGG